MNVISMQEYRARKALPVIVRAVCFVPVMMLAVCLTCFVLALGFTLEKEEE
jgi:hypothetical protein